MKAPRKWGFTLIELSIVLVIIGLIVGGIVVGRELVKQATIRRQISQFQEYETAYLTFKQKYNCIAGDCVNATTFFSGAVNGNGNQKIENNQYQNYDNGASWQTSYEYKFFFDELSDAGLVKDIFDTTTTLVGKAMPALIYNNQSGFFVADSVNFCAGGGNCTPAGRNPNMLSYKRGNNLFWIVACAVGTYTMNAWDDSCGIFIPVDLKQIDQKMDDGLPLSGRFLGFGGYLTNNNCLNAGNTDYDGTKSTAECQAAYVLDK